MSEARAFAFRERALQAHNKAMRAGIPETTRRAWLIVERDWIRMAEREKLNDAISTLEDAFRSSGRQVQAPKQIEDARRDPAGR